MTPEEQATLGKMIEKTGEMIDLTRQKVELLQDLRRVYWAAQKLDIHPKDLGPVKFKAVTESHHVQRKSPGWLGITHDGRTVMVRLCDAPPEVWPDTIHTPHGPRPLPKPTCNESNFP
jgi:hypothetical protein